MGRQEPLLSKQSKKGLSAIEGRGLVLVTAGLLFAILLTSMPTVFHLWDPTPDYKSQAINCQKKEDVPIQGALDSPCKSALLKDDVLPGTTTIQNVSVLKCSFNETEKDIQKVLEMFNSTLQIFDPKSKQTSKMQECLTDVVPLVCNILYRNCENPGLLPTRETCLAVKNEVCSIYWEIAASLLHSTTARGRCLALPDCKRDFPAQNNSNPGNGSQSGNSDMVLSDTVLFNPSEVASDCKKPLVPTTLLNPLFPLKCSPACLEDSWASESETVALDVVLDFTVIFNWICCIFTFITWAVVPELRRFPTITPLFLVISYAIANFELSLPVFLGRHRAYCSHKDVFSVMIDPSTVCKIQGISTHFGFLSAAVWWLCCIFNVFIIAYSKSPSHIIANHPRILFFIEFLASVVLPGTMVGLVMGIGGTYTTFSVQVVLCGPPTKNLTYFTASLPLQIIVLSGSILMAMVTIRLRKVRAFRASCNKRIDSNIYKAIEKRFILLIIFFPLCLGFLCASVGIFSQLAENQRPCPADYRKYGSVAVSIVDLVVLDILGVVLMVSTLLPQPARQFWRRLLRKCFRCERNTKTPAGRTVTKRKSIKLNKPAISQTSYEDVDCTAETGRDDLNG